MQKHGDVVSCTQFLVFSFLDFPSIRPTIMRLVQSYTTYMLFHLRKKPYTIKYSGDFTTLLSLQLIFII